MKLRPSRTFRGRGAFWTLGSSDSKAGREPFLRRDPQTYYVTAKDIAGGLGGIVLRQTRVLSGAAGGARRVRCGTNVSPDVLRGNQQHSGDEFATG
jgi:hypothetical protein